MQVYQRAATALAVVCTLYLCLVAVYYSRPRLTTVQLPRLDYRPLTTVQLPRLDYRPLTAGPEQSRQYVPSGGQDSDRTSPSLQQKFLENQAGSDPLEQDRRFEGGSKLSLWSAADKQQISLLDDSKEVPRVRLRKLNERADIKENPPFPTLATQMMFQRQPQHVKQREVKFHALGDKVFIYGAFLDSRYEDCLYIRALALQSGSAQMSQIKCWFSADSGERIAVRAEHYEMCENHGKQFGGWIYSCRVPQNLSNVTQNVDIKADNGESRQAFMVSLHVQPVTTRTASTIDQKMSKPSSQFTTNVFDNADGGQANTTVSSNTSKHSNNITKYKNKLKLAVCVPPLYGSIGLSKIINFIEMCKLLGAYTIFLYVDDIPADILTFLQNYTGGYSNFLTLVKWRLPIYYNRGGNNPDHNVIWNHGQLLAVQHCLYSHMAQFDWLLFIDFDEMLVPKQQPNWAEMLLDISSQFSSQSPTHQIAGVSFKSAFFQQDFGVPTSNSIHYFQYLDRTKNTNAARSKLFVRPAQVFEMGIHHISKAVSQEAAIIQAKEEQALLHHFRQCPADAQCDLLVKDWTMLRYQHALSLTSRRVLADAARFFSITSDRGS